MKTSRIAQETSKATSAINRSGSIARRQTRALTASLQAFSAIDPLNPDTGVPLKQESTSTISSSLSPERDLEDSFPSTPRSSKRRRTGITTSTITTTASRSASARTSHRKKELDEEVATNSQAKKAKRQPAKKVLADDGEVKFEPPPNWEEIYQNVQKMREERNAPVDTMGCETLAEEHLTARDKRFQTLIALMLSSQTKDTTNAIAIKKLQTELPSPGLTLENILDVDPVKLNELIYVVGFHNNKTRYIKAAAEILRDEFKGDIPDTIEGLMSLPGVGPKMAYLCMSAAWGRTEGIGVDVQYVNQTGNPPVFVPWNLTSRSIGSVHRITNLWGWHKTKGPEETRLMLESWLPRDKWHEINHLLVGFGQTICAPVGRKCGQCLLSAKGLCPSAVVEKKSTVKRVEKKSVKDDLAVNKSEAVVVKQEDLIEADEGPPR